MGAMVGAVGLEPAGQVRVAQVKVAVMLVVVVRVEEAAMEG